jgi:uncharacterized cupin superfamily protein
MPKIDIAAVEKQTKTTYPPQYAKDVVGRVKQRIGDAAGLTQFGVNLVSLAPGAQSSQKHWHRAEDEFVYVLSGEVVLVEDTGDTTLRAGDAAGFKAGVAVGHTVVNRSGAPATYLEVGTRVEADVVTYTDPKVDMVATKEAGGPWKMTRRDGSPF